MALTISDADVLRELVRDLKSDATGEELILEIRPAGLSQSPLARVIGEVDDWKALGHAIAANTTSKMLGLRNFRTRELTAMAEGLKLSIALEILVLSYNTVEDAFAKVLGEVMASNTSLKELRLAKCDLKDSSLSLLAEGIELNTTLERLDLSSNVFVDAGAKTLAQVLASPRASLRELRLHSCGIGAAGLTALALSMKLNSKLEVLVLSSNHFGDAGVEVLGVQVLGGANTALKELRLMDCSIGAAALTALADGMRKNSALTLEILDVSRNNFGDDGAKTLGEILAYNTRLRELRFHHCIIGPARLQAFAAAMKPNTMLEVLDVSNNNFGDDGAFALAHVLSLMKSLKELHLGDCGVLVEGGRAIGRAWGGNWALKDLSFIFNSRNDGCDERTLLYGAEQVRRSDKLLCFGMGIHPRQGGSADKCGDDGMVGEGENFTLQALDADIFRLIGDAYTIHDPTTLREGGGVRENVAGGVFDFWEPRGE